MTHSDDSGRGRKTVPLIAKGNTPDAPCTSDFAMRLLADVEAKRLASRKDREFSCLPAPRDGYEWSWVNFEWVEVDIFYEDF